MSGLRDSRKTRILGISQHIPHCWWWTKPTKYLVFSQASARLFFRISNLDIANVQRQSIILQIPVKTKHGRVFANTMCVLHFYVLCLQFSTLYFAVPCFVFCNFVFKEQPRRAKFCQQNGSPSFTPAFIKSSSYSSSIDSTRTIPKLKYQMAKVTTRKYRPYQSPL